MLECSGWVTELGEFVCVSHNHHYHHVPGHARAYVTYDVLLRVLQQHGYDVLYVRNFTDIDDKIINRYV